MTRGPRYDVVIAAQSFHWADPGTRWSRLGSLIRPEGRAFLLWNGWAINPATHDIAAVERIYQAQGTGLQPDTGDHRSQTSWAESEINAEPGLALVGADHYSWDWRLPIQDYLGLMTTTSQYAVADAASRHQLFASLAAALGPQVDLKGRTVSHVVAPSSAVAG